MSKAKWLLVFLIALGMSVPAQAIELSLGGFPSFMRTRARYINGATYVNTLSDSQAQSLGLESSDDDIFFVDTTLRLTPQLVLSDTVTIRGQIDVLRNNVWGGVGSGAFGAGNGAGNGCVVGACTADDSFRGGILLGEKTFDLGSDNNNFFNVRMLHADIVLPHNLGFVRIGRQPFDWGMGIWANGGWDPASDLGFLPERFLWLKTFPVGDASLTQVLVSDVVSNNSFLFNGGGTIGASANGTTQGFGKTFDIIAGATILNMDIGGVNTTLGAFYFPFVQQSNVADRLGFYSGLIDLKTDLWRFVYEIDLQEGELSDTFAGTDVDLQMEMAGRIEIYPSWPVKMIGIEGGWSQGDDANTPEVDGNLVPFSPAYNIDNLLFKHIIPTLYNNEGSVQNAFYARAWTTVKLTDHFAWTPHVLAAWIHETDTTSGLNGVPLPDGSAGDPIVYDDLDRFLGVEVENTVTWTVYPGVNLDLIGSVVFAGDGLKDLQEQAGAAAIGEDVDGNATDVPWAVQTRLTIFIDQFLK